MRRALIVVDMQRGFMSPEGTLYCGDAARRIIPEIRALVDHHVQAGDLVLFTADTHTPDDKEFQMFPPHCIAGTSEVEIIPELAGQAARQTVVPKRRYSAFFETDLAEMLAAHQPDLVTVTGVCTDICVMHTVADLRNRDYKVEVPANAVASFDPAAHDWALQHMERILGATVLRAGVREQAE